MKIIFKSVIFFLLFERPSELAKNVVPCRSRLSPNQRPWSCCHEQLQAPGDQRQRATSILDLVTGPGLSAFPVTQAEASKTCGDAEGCLRMGAGRTQEEWRQKNRKERRQLLLHNKL